jgi:hypothetical protein
MEFTIGLILRPAATWPYLMALPAALPIALPKEKYFAKARRPSKGIYFI